MTATPLVILLLAVTGAIEGINGHYRGGPATTTITHTLRVTTTSDVTVTTTTSVDVPVTQYITLPNFIPEDPRTVQSLIRVTNTPVELKTVIVDANTVRTLLTTFTNFHTNTVTVQSVTTVTHYSTTYEVETRPVVITKNLQQDVIITSTQIATITSTLTTAGYY
ncbi:uncharacterized protein [Panulirus ornatus]|uniref:uncharacterized protein isoform X1 n=1 Tax=Panulirus ornatus TaxID=150431 RepID=UPI003A8B333E